MKNWYIKPTLFKFLSAPNFVLNRREIFRHWAQAPEHTLNPVHSVLGILSCILIMIWGQHLRKKWFLGGDLMQKHWRHRPDRWFWWFIERPELQPHVAFILLRLLDKCNTWTLSRRSRKTEKWRDKEMVRQTEILGPRRKLMRLELRRVHWKSIAYAALPRQGEDNYSVHPCQAFKLHFLSFFLITGQIFSPLLLH